MKPRNLFLFFVFILISSENLPAQSIDSVVVKLTQSGGYGSQSGQWFDIILETDSFHNQKIVYKLFEYLDKATWVPQQYESFQYDSVGRLTEDIKWHYFYINSCSKISYQYDSTNSVIIVDSYSSTGTQWITNPHCKIIHELNVLGKDSIVTSYSDSATMLTQFYKTEYTYNSSDSVTQIINESYNNGNWTNYSYDNFHYYNLASGISVYDTIFSANSSSSYFDIATKKIYDINNDLVHTKSNYYYDPANSSDFTYTCNHQIATSYSSSGGSMGSATLDSIFYDSLCHPVADYAFYYSNNGGGSSRTLYYYPSQNYIWTSLPDSVYFCSGDSLDLEIKIHGGVQPYHISWSPAVGLSNDTIANPVAFPPVPINYSVSITDANGINISRQIFVEPKSIPVAHLHIQSIDTITSCNSAVLSVDSIPGTGTKWWFNGASFYNNSTHYTARKNGIYVVETSNNYSCGFYDTIVVNSLLHGQPDIQITSHCDQLIATVQYPDSFQWFNYSGIMPGQINDTLIAGSYDYYYVKVVDSYGCSAISPWNHFQPFALQLYKSNSCIDHCSGTATAGLYSFHAPLTYNWSNGDTSRTTFNLCPGSYFVTVTDSNGCVLTDTTVIDTLSRLNLTLTSSVVTDTSVYNGVAVISQYNNVISYLWDNGSTNFYSDSLGYGWHSVITTSNTGCSQTDSVFINTSPQPRLCSMIDSVSHEVCPVQCRNNIHVKMTSGIPPATYFWTDSSIANKLDSTSYRLCEGDYHCVMIDAVGCIDSIQVHITDQPIQPLINILYYDPADPCQTLVEVSFANYSPTSITWCNGSTGSTARVCPGECFIRLDESYFCSVTIPFIVTIPSCGAFVSKQEISCHGICDGKLKVSAAGIPPFSFTWSNNDTSQSIDNLCPGLYSVFFRDDSTCFDTVTVELVDPPALSALFTTTYNDCHDDCKTSADITGGTPPYSITWCDSIITTDLHECVVSCPVTIIDQHGCLISDSIVHEQHSTLEIFSEVRDATCGNCLDGVIRLSATGGVPPYHFYQGPPIEWIVADSLFHLPYGIYHVCVSDDNGCDACMFATVNLTPGNNSQSQENLVIYKSVSENSIKVLLKNAPAGKQLLYTIYDIAGREIRKEKMNPSQFEIVPGEFNAGLYFFTIETTEVILEKGKIVLLK